MKNPYLVLDTETTIMPADSKQVGGPGPERANPYGGSVPVYVGWKSKNVYTPSMPSSRREAFAQLHCMLTGMQADVTPILIGHNINYDLHQLCAENQPLSLPPFAIWDTMTVHYYLNGQASHAQMQSLDALSKFCGLPVKDGKITEYFKRGIDADKIPKDEILPYLKQDVLNTESIFLAQFAQAATQGQLPFIREMMDAQLLCFFMEHTGMWVDPHVALSLEQELSETRQRLLELTKRIMTKAMPGTSVKVSPNSPAQVLKVLRGGTYKVRQTRPDGLYKNGKPKEKVLYADHVVKQLDGCKYRLASTGVKELKKALRTATGDALDFIEALLEYRDVDKKFSTYVMGYFAKVDSNGILRTSYNHAVTPTGRLSSSNPNLQNIPKRKA